MRLTKYLPCVRTPYVSRKYEYENLLRNILRVRHISFSHAYSLFLDSLQQLCELLRTTRPKTVPSYFELNLEVSLRSAPTTRLACRTVT